MTDEYDVLVIGAGSGGMAAAKRAASRGASVGVVENRTVGGTCVARGCMPKKFLVYASRRMRSIKAGGPQGLESEVTNLDWTDVIDHQQAVVDDLIDANTDGLLDRDGIELIEGTAEFVDDHRLEVNGESYEAEKIIVATGMRPSTPPIEGVEHGITSDEFLRDHNLPYSMTIVGGGYISVEFASILNQFGVDVTIFQRPGSLVKNQDHTISEALEETLTDRGITVMTGTEVQSIEKVERNYVVSYDGEDESGQFGAERVLIAAGRTPNTEELGLDTVGIDTDDGFIPVDESMQTERDHIYAVGDVAGEYPFTPVAIAEGKVAGDNVTAGNPDEAIDYTAIPSAVFTEPEVGSVGLTEQEARAKHDRIQTAEKSFRPFSSVVRREPEETTIKLIYNGEDQTLIGLHVLAPDASEIVQGFAVAMRNGLELDDMKDFPGIHPTIAEEIFSTKP